MFLVIRVHNLVYFFSDVWRNGGEKLEDSVNRSVEGVLGSRSLFFTICFMLVEPMFYGFDILVAEVVPSEFSYFVGGYVKLAVLQSCSYLLGNPLHLAQEPTVHKVEFPFFFWVIVLEVHAGEAGGVPEFSEESPCVLYVFPSEGYV